MPRGKGRGEGRPGNPGNRWFDSLYRLHYFYATRLMLNMKENKRKKMSFAVFLKENDKRNSIRKFIDIFKPDSMTYDEAFSDLQPNLAKVNRELYNFFMTKGHMVNEIPDLNGLSAEICAQYRERGFKEQGYWARNFMDVPPTLTLLPMPSDLVAVAPDVAVDDLNNGTEAENGTYNQGTDTEIEAGTGHGSGEGTNENKTSNYDGTTNEDGTELKKKGTEKKGTRTNNSETGDGTGENGTAIDGTIKNEATKKQGEASEKGQKKVDGDIVAKLKALKLKQINVHKKLRTPNRVNIEADNLELNFLVELENAPQHHFALLCADEEIDGQNQPPIAPDVDPAPIEGFVEFPQDSPERFPVEPMDVTEDEQEMIELEVNELPTVARYFYVSVNELHACEKSVAVDRKDIFSFSKYASLALLHVLYEKDGVYSVNHYPISLVPAYRNEQHYRHIRTVINNLIARLIEIGVVGLAFTTDYGQENLSINRLISLVWIPCAFHKLQNGLTKVCSGSGNIFRFGGIVVKVDDVRDACKDFSVFPQGHGLNPKLTKFWDFKPTEEANANIASVRKIGTRFLVDLLRDLHIHPSTHAQFMPLCIVVNIFAQFSIIVDALADKGFEPNPSPESNNKSAEDIENAIDVLQSIEFVDDPKQVAKVIFDDISDSITQLLTLLRENNISRVPPGLISTAPIYILRSFAAVKNGHLPPSLQWLVSNFDLIPGQNQSLPISGGSEFLANDMVLESLPDCLMRLNGRDIFECSVDPVQPPQPTPADLILATEMKRFDASLLPFSEVEVAQGLAAVRFIKERDGPTKFEGLDQRMIQLIKFLAGTSVEPHF